MATNDESQQLQPTEDVVMNDKAENSEVDASLDKKTATAANFNENSSPSSSTTSISAGVAWWLAMVTMLLICGPLLMGLGIARGWNTVQGSFAFPTVYDPSRFWPEPNEYNETAALDAQIPSRNFPAAASLWYYWKYRPSNSDAYCDATTLPPEPYTMSCQVPQATAATRAFVWTCYVVHQCAIWGLTYQAQREHAQDVQYHSHLRWYNVWSLLVNLAGYLVHLLQTHLTYDATAQDVTESSSQGSVIMLLVMVLLMEYKHRGLFLGWPAARQQPGSRCSWRLPTRPIELVRKYHGYAFSWATIYTLWYHPMEPTVGHVMGFLHTAMLLIQQSLMFTPVHVNKYWKLLLETWVAIHGGVVALQMGHGWAMFVFGFGWVFAFTAIHGIPYYLGFVQVAQQQNNGDELTMVGVPKAQWVRYLVRLVPPTLYFAVVLAVYATVLVQEDGTINPLFITEIIRIPAILYLLVIFTAFVAWGMISTANACFGENEIPQFTTEENVKVEADVPPPADGEAETSDDSPADSLQQQKVPPAQLGTGSVMAGFAVCYMLMIVISIIIEQLHVRMDLLILMFLCVVIFTIFSLVAMVLMDKQMHRTALGSPQLPGASQ